MKIAIRVDASDQIGTGHFMRCLSLANEFKKHGEEIRFICRHLPEHLRIILAEQGHQSVLLESPFCESKSDDLTHSHWLGTSQRVDARDSINALADHFWDWLIVDHYALDERWELALREVARNILVIDDIADRQHNCAVLLDQNFYENSEIRYRGKVPAHCRLLTGPRYALLREEFRLLRETVKPREGTVKRILVFFGGVDANNYTGLAVQALSNLTLKKIAIDVVIGAQHPYRDQIESACATHNFQCHVQTNRMGELMLAADLAIGAGGSATWERCCLGLPTFAICTAKNQLMQIAEAATKGWLYAPSIKNGLIQTIERHTLSLIDNERLIQAISKASMRVVDGRGVLRVIGSIGSSNIEIRKACKSDSEQLLEWRNHSTIRLASRNPAIINQEDHHRWFAAVISSSSRLLLIGRRNDIPVGVVRFDKEDDAAEVSIYVDPYINEPGLGGKLLRSAEQWLLKNQPCIARVYAHVIADNARSHRLFLGAGYEIESTYYSKILYQND